jgi:hypothetical protein
VDFAYTSGKARPDLAGAMPLGMVNGQQVLLVAPPRSFRGGLSFIF